MIRKVLNKKLMKLTPLHDENNRIFKSIVSFEKDQKITYWYDVQKECQTRLEPDGPERQNKNNVTNYVI